MRTVRSLAATVQGAPFVGLGHLEKNDGLVFLGDNADVADRCLGNLVGQLNHVAAVAVDEFPVHERFHVADIGDAGEEIADEQLAARAEHLKHGPSEALGSGQG